MLNVRHRRQADRSLMLCSHNAVWVSICRDNLGVTRAGLSTRFIVPREQDHLYGRRITGARSVTEKSAFASAHRYAQSSMIIRFWE
jgi:hypothetical protein